MQARSVPGLVLAWLAPARALSALGSVGLVLPGRALRSLALDQELGRTGSPVGEVVPGPSAQVLGKPHGMGGGDGEGGWDAHMWIHLGR